MRSLLAGLAGLVVVALLGWMIYSSTVSGLQQGDERVKTAMANIKTEEVRRTDLIPNLVKTVEAAGYQEKSTLEAVIKARAEATKTIVNVSAAELVNDPAKLKAAQDAAATFQGTLSRLLVSTEAYPQLKANEGYMTLMKQLEGTENRIKTARRDYNEAVRVNNLAVRHPWSGMFANAAGAKIRDAFDVPEERRAPVTVEFNKKS